MKMNGERLLLAAREQVWTALNDPDVLKKCIPGCQSLEKLSDTELQAKVTAKVGPVKANFAGQVELSDLNPPESYRISGQGKGGAAGFAKGGAEVKLTETPEGTLLSYDVDAQVGGKLAQIGSRLISSTAKKMADDFFDKFAEEVGGDATNDAAQAVDQAARPEMPAVAETAGTAGTPGVSSSPQTPETKDRGSSGGINWWTWVIMAVAIVWIAYIITG